MGKVKNKKFMTKKEFFIKKIIPQIQEQIWTYEYHIIRNQFALERLKRQLRVFERSQVLKPGEKFTEREAEKESIKREIEEAKRNLQVLPLLKAGEEEFLEYFQKVVQSL